MMTREAHVRIVRRGDVMRIWRLSILAVPLLVAACSQSPTGSMAPSQAASTEATSTAAPSASGPVAGCPNPDGGSCLGLLEAGTYSTTVFGLGLTYTVTEGWGNFEDLPGQVAFVPPHGDTDAVNAGLSDYVGVVDSVAPASADCEEHAQDGVDATVEAMLEWYASLEGLAMTTPMPTTIGGLAGYVTDLTIADGYVKGCPYVGFEGIPMVPLIISVPPADLHHVVMDGVATRLYLLSGPEGQPIAIEVNDVPGLDSFDDMDAVIQTFEFGR